MTDVDEIVKRVNALKDKEEIKLEWPGGWPDEAEVALLDAVFSAQARYGTVTNVIDRWRRYRSRQGADGSLDDLGGLASWKGVEPLADVLGNHQRVPGGSQTKADAVIAAASNFVHNGLNNAEDLLSGAEKNWAKTRSMYVSVAGLGDVTWRYLLMLLGRPGVKADVMIRRFVAQTLDLNDISPDDAANLIGAAAATLGTEASHLDHGIWLYQRNQPRKAR